MLDLSDAYFVIMKKDAALTIDTQLKNIGVERGLNLFSVGEEEKFEAKLKEIFNLAKTSSTETPKPENKVDPVLNEKRKEALSSDSNWYTVSEVSKLSGYSTAWVYTRINNGVQKYSVREHKEKNRSRTHYSKMICSNDFCEEIKEAIKKEIV